MTSRWLPILCVVLAAATPLAGQADSEDVIAGRLDFPGLPADPPAHAIRLQIDVPGPGAVVESATHLVELRGTAFADAGKAQPFEIMIVLDVSQSTKAASGADVDGDGVIGENPQEGLFLPGEYPEDVWSTDPEDTILAAEVTAARALLESLDPARVQVGLISFSGAVNLETGGPLVPGQRDARLEVPLTDDYGQVHSALDAILARGASGATNFAAGIHLATAELAGLSGATSRPSADARKVILFLTDGVPTFPIGKGTVSDAGDLEAALNAARVARAGGIRINTYALGTGALARPLAATEVARATLGSFTPVLEPGRIVAALQSVSFTNVEDVAVMNLTTREDTPDLRLNPDGSFLGFVPVREGRNRILVNAVASNGAETNLVLDVEFRLARVEGEMLARDLARLRELNNELLRQLEAERIRREKRRQRMTRELEIRTTPPPTP